MEVVGGHYCRLSAISEGSHTRLCSPLFGTRFGGPTSTSGSARGALQVARQCPWTGLALLGEIMALYGRFRRSSCL